MNIPDLIKENAEDGGWRCKYFGHGIWRLWTNGREFKDKLGNVDKTNNNPKKESMFASIKCPAKIKVIAHAN